MLVPYVKYFALLSFWKNQEYDRHRTLFLFLDAGLPEMQKLRYPLLRTPNNQGLPFFQSWTRSEYLYALSVAKDSVPLIFSFLAPYFEPEV